MKANSGKRKTEKARVWAKESVCFYCFILCANVPSLFVHSVYFISSHWTDIMFDIDFIIIRVHFQSQRAKTHAIWYACCVYAHYIVVFLILLATFSHSKSLFLSFLAAFVELQQHHQIKEYEKRREVKSRSTFCVNGNRSLHATDVILNETYYTLSSKTIAGLIDQHHRYYKSHNLFKRWQYEEEEEY